MVNFLAYLEGTVSPQSQAWPVYVRKDLLAPPLNVGSYIKICGADVQITSTSQHPYGTGTFLDSVNGMISQC